MKSPEVSSPTSFSKLFLYTAKNMHVEVHGRIWDKLLYIIARTR